ncbi:M64 family metallopeptidase [Streptomyces cyaneofuscatus]|uniref:M64 family metallopeptidase n=1 Tax=Streptomyces cyaneofuscatus TaxID=66883 RepID=UPI0033B246EF
MRRRRSPLIAAAALAFALASAVPAGSAAAGSTSATEWREVFSPDGRITRVRIPEQTDHAPTARDLRAAAAAKITPLLNAGSSDERFDVVIVGDGYTASESGLLRQHAEAKWAEIAATEPWNKHRHAVNVWLVDVVSNQSGVDNDPGPGVSRDTALDMGFFCGGLERLLCLNEAKAQSYARQAPGMDAIVAIGNTTKYGGAGYPSLATVAGGNAQAGRIAIHELGHSVGGLADEYWTPGTTYSGGEPGEPNVTRDPRGSKWASYQGRSTPDGGVIGAYQGGHQYERGIYRPSQDSLMRNINKPFNLIGLDTMDRAIGSKISGTPSPGPGCATHRNTRTGTLATGGSAYQPDSGSFSARTGTHRACLDNPAGFGLSLLSWKGSAWRTVATSGTNGTLTYSGADGHYVYQVRSTTGSGPYTLRYDAP